MIRTIITRAFAILATAVLLLGCRGEGPVVIDPNATPSADLSIRARSNDFDARYLVAPAGQPFSVTLVNEDAGTLHNFAIYRDNGARQMVFRGESFAGKKSAVNHIPRLEAGRYYFRCDVHPDMNGALVVKEQAPDGPGVAVP